MTAPARPVVRFLDRSTPPHLVTLVLVAGVPALSLNIFLPSLPSMARHFGVDYQLMQLSVSLYLAMTACVQLLIGPLADRFGRRPVLLTVTALFILATLGTILAPGFVSFMACRMAQAALDMMMERAVSRKTRGKPLSDFQMVQEMVACDLEQARQHALLKHHGYTVQVSREK
jgi:DHA1 family bicyclomycin/chloramphenicol resistance-like MFS transporter